MRSAGLLLLSILTLATGCCVNPFHHTRDPEARRASEPEPEARRSIQPEQPAVQPAGNMVDDPGAGFDIRLVRVQPGVHMRTIQACDVIFSSRPEAVEGRAAERYVAEVVQRMAIKCHASTGEGWADLVFDRSDGAKVAEVRRGRRVRVRILAAEGGYFDYPIVQFVRAEGENPELARLSTTRPVTVPNGFDLTELQSDPALVGSVQQCAVAFNDEIELVQGNDQRSRNYPTGVQNRMTVRCKHDDGEEPADLVFMPAQALAALRVRRGEVIPVRLVSRNGGFVDYPIVQFAGQ